MASPIKFPLWMLVFNDSQRVSYQMFDDLTCLLTFTEQEKANEFARRRNAGSATQRFDTDKEFADYLEGLLGTPFNGIAVDADPETNQAATAELAAYLAIVRAKYSDPKNRPN